MERAATYFADLREANANRRLYARTMKELQMLSSRELADLGLCRSSLHDTAFQAVYGK